MKKLLQLFAILGIIIILISALAVFLATNEFEGAITDSVEAGYFSYNGAESKIFLIAVSSSQTVSNETFSAPKGEIILQGTPLLILHATLKNDYSADTPAPPVTVPMAPADGTAYVYLTAQLYDNSKSVNATNVSSGDFFVTNKEGTGIVLASGQTVSVTVCIAFTANTNRYNLILSFLGDSIPT
jgi:hypothetical protein